MRIALPIFMATLLAVPSVAQAQIAPGDRYNGSYTCGNTITPVVIEVTGDSIGYFNFGGPNSPRGRYLIQFVEIGRNDYQLTPLRWEIQPANYVMVAARVTISDGRLNGTIKNASCGKIVAKNESYVAQPPTPLLTLAEINSLPSRASMHAAVQSLMDDAAPLDAPGMSVPEYVGNEGSRKKFRITYRWGGGKDGLAYVLVSNANKIDCIKFGNSDYCRKYYTPEEIANNTKIAEENGRKLAREIAIKYQYGVPYADKSGSTDCMRDTELNSFESGTDTKTVDGYGNQRTDSFRTSSRVQFRNICTKPVTYKFHSDYVTIAGNYIDTWSCRYRSGENLLGQTISWIDYCWRTESAPFTRSKR